jgi:hypothetical protein
VKRGRFGLCLICISAHASGNQGLLDWIAALPDFSLFR